jgi:hypothetical protein
MRKRTLVVALIALEAVVLAGAAWSSQGSQKALATHEAAAASAATPSALAPYLAKARAATARYATDLARAKRDGYTVIVTRQIPNMGWHFMNPKLTKFDVTRPAILVYDKRGSQWQLVAFEWVFPTKPAKLPLPGAKYGAFPAACHYQDGTFLPAATQDDCAKTSPQTGAAFGFWHPNLVTLHLWLWYPNPSGIYAGFNPLMKPFNQG